MRIEALKTVEREFNPGVNELKDSFTLGPSADVTQLPGSMKRRIWTAPQVTSHSCVVLTATKIFLVPGTSPPPAETVKALEQGADPNDLFGDLVVMTMLPSVRKVTHDLLTNTVIVQSFAGSGVTGQWTAQVSLSFATAEAADAMFSKLWRRLGDTFQIRPNGERPTRNVQGLLIVQAAILLATAFLVWGSNAAADAGGATYAWLKPLAAIDWRIAAILGGIASAFVQVGLYRRMTQPPTRLELSPARRP